MRTLWLRRYATPSAPRLRLICIPYAGAGASVYRDWRLPNEAATETWAVQLPGRENRFREPPLRRVEPVVDGVVAELANLVDLPYAIFGHSMGALLAFEVTRRMRLLGLPTPVRLFVSAYQAPDLPARREPASALPEDEFLARLDEMAGSSASAVRDPELRELLAPMLRADFEICETYTYRPGSPLTTPMSCFCAVDDPEVDPEDVAGWPRHTTGASNLRSFNGGHLYLLDRADEILHHIVEDLGGLIAR